MAGFSGVRTSHNPRNPPLSKDIEHNYVGGGGSNQKKHVAFSELPQRRSNMYEDIQDSYAKRRGNRYCFMCCAWICISITAFLMIIFILGLIAVGVLHSSLPEITVNKVHATSISIKESSRQKYLTMSMNVGLEFENENEKMSLHYEALTADIRAEEVRIGHTTIAGFSQESDSKTKLDFNTTTTNSRIDDGNAEILKTRYRQKAMVIDLVIAGKVGFRLAGWKIEGLPFEASCRKVNEAFVHSDYPPKCFTKLLSFS